MAFAISLFVFNSHQKSSLLKSNVEAMAGGFVTSCYPAENKICVVFNYETNEIVMIISGSSPDWPIEPPGNLTVH